MKEIYLDNSATTKVYPQVVKEMAKYYSMEYGNASSMHALGEEALKALNEARKKLAAEIGAKPNEIIFTSGGTESDNLALQGLAKAHYEKKKIIISAIEHAAVLETARSLEKWGYKVVRIPVNKEGVIEMEILRNEIDKNTLLVSVMHVNNIIGTIQPIAEIGKICRERGALFHTDAVQSYGKLGIDVKKMNIDLLSASAHKLGGAKGVGFLYVREGVKIEALFYGGGQERGLRSGTENVAGIAGFAKALELSRKINKRKIEKTRDKMIDELQKIGGKINGSQKDRIYNNIHVSFLGIEANALVVFLSGKGIYVSTGSACESKKEKEDHVLEAIGLGEKDMLGSIRISLGEINDGGALYVIKEIKKAVDKLRI